MSDETWKDFVQFTDYTPYRVVYKNVYTRVAEKLLKKQGVDTEKTRSILSDAQSVCGLVGETLDDLLSSVSTYSDKLRGSSRNMMRGSSIKVFKRKSITDGEGFFYWWHQENSDIEKEVKKEDFFLDREKLRGAVGAYLNTPDAQDDWLDWYCADLLCYMEMIATIKDTKKQVHGTLSYMFRNIGNPWSILVQALIFVLKWVVWFLYLAWIFNKGDRLAYSMAAFLIFGTLYVQFMKLSLWRKRSKIVEAMYRVYAVLDTTSFSWNVLWREMEDARKLGAIWDGELWRMVEMRMNRG